MSVPRALEGRIKESFDEERYEEGIKGKNKENHGKLTGEEAKKENKSEDWEDDSSDDDSDSDMSDDKPDVKKDKQLNPKNATL